MTAGVPSAVVYAALPVRVSATASPCPSFSGAATTQVAGRASAVVSGSRPRRAQR